jgi:hypothetical protein
MRCGAASKLPRIAHHHRAAPSRARRRRGRDRDRRRPQRGGALARPAADRGTDVYVADTIGELGLIYRLAPIVFMGGSLVRHGGQNPIEAAKLGAAILHGPHVWNFSEIYQALDDARGAEEVLDVNRLAVRIGAWLTDAAPSASRSPTAGARDLSSKLGALRFTPHARGDRAVTDAARPRTALWRA